MASEYTLIDTVDALSALIPSFCGLPSSPPSLYLDLEGQNLGKDGTVSLIQIYVLPLKHTYLIDVQVLGNAAFTTTSTAPVSTPSLKAILESPSIPKCLFDVRADSNALFFLHGVSMQGIHDIQLMELARRPGLYVNGLAKCIESDAGLNWSAKQAFKRTKEEGSKLFMPTKGGSWAILCERPIKTQIIEYCVHDVKHLPTLWRLYKTTDNHSQRRIESATLDRIALSKDPKFDRNGRNMALGPWGDPLQKQWDNHMESGQDDYDYMYLSDEGCDHYEDYDYDDFDMY